MPASIATVVTTGFGSFGSAHLLPTLGFGINQAPPPVLGPGHVDADARLTPQVRAGAGLVPRVSATARVRPVTGADAGLGGV